MYLAREWWPNSSLCQAKAVKQAFEAERTYLLVASKSKQPDVQPPELMTELHRHTSAVDEIREGNRPSPLFNHLSAVSEGIVALGWIVDKRPNDFVTATLGGAQYYGNKVLKEYKEKYEPHVQLRQSNLQLQGQDSRRIYPSILQDFPISGRLREGTFCYGSYME